MKTVIKKLYLIYVSLIIHSFIYAQFSQLPVIYLPQGHVLDGLSGYGYNKTTRSTISNINGSNPACVHDFYRRNAAISYQFESKIREAYTADIGYKRILNFKPQSFSFVFPYGYFRIGLAVSQLFNAETDYGNVPLVEVDTTAQGYIETGIVHSRKQEIIYKNSVTLSYNFLKLFHSSDTLLIGFRYNSNQLECKHNIGIPNRSFERRFFESNFSIGLRYDLPHFKGNCLKLGFYYETEINFDKKTDINNISVQYIGNIPEKLHAGFLYNIKSKIFLSSDISILFWKNVDKESSDKNQVELSWNAGYTFRKNLHISFGLFHTERKFEQYPLLFDLNNLEATYLMTGLVYYYQFFSFELTLADSHLFSDTWRKQFIAKFAVGYNF
jgi:hypothetical protein